MTQDENVETIVPAGEAALVTRDSMNDLVLMVPNNLPDDEVPPAVKFLTAVMLRADEEPGWVESMIDWVERRMQEDEIGETAGEA